MSAVKEMQIEQEFVKIEGKKHNISRELGSALKREHKRVEALEKDKEKRLAEEIKLLAQNPIVVETPWMKITATMYPEGSIASHKIEADPCIRNNLVLMLEHQARCFGMIMQEWCGLNKQVMEKIYGKMEEPVTEQRNEQATKNLQIAA